ncbi:MAG TPA: type II toxin-antitoxin system RelE/ParE family toxin [Leptospiraceae bacterium]|nr:type II toxin-antitoxin system RelE/ParE family toxin [Leptospiraceae bacterium]
MEVSWSETALKDLSNIYDFISQDSVGYAGGMADKLIDAADRLGTFPNIGRKVPEFDQEHIREVLVGPYRLMYSRAPSILHIVTILHGSRDILAHIQQENFVL